MRWLIYTFTAFALVIGCASTSLDLMPPDQDVLPPPFKVVTSKDRQTLDYFFLKMADANKDRKVHWWVEYRRAKLWEADDPSLACGKFAALGQTRDFPLRDLALIRAHATCARVANTPELPSLDGVAARPWLDRARLDAQLTEARAKDKWDAEFDLLIEQSKLPLEPEIKLEFIEGGLKIARKHEDKERTELALERREKIAPRFNRKPKPIDYLIMAHDFRRARQFKDARKYYEKAAAEKKLDESRRIGALRGLAQTYKLEHDKEKHLATLAKITERTKPAKKEKLRSRSRWRAHFEAVIHFARAMWTEGDVRGARNLLIKSAGTFNRKVPRTEIFWLLGRMEEEKRNYDKAIGYFQLADAEASAPSELKEKVLWYLAWNERKRQKWPEAIRALELGKVQSQNEFSRNRFHYWLARTYKDSGDEKAEASYDELTKLDPLGYYGILAHRDLGRKLRRPEDPVAAAAAAAVEPSRIREILDLPVAEWLIAVDEFDTALELLDFTAEQLRRNPAQNANDTTWTDLLGYYAKAGAYQHLYERLGTILPDQRQNILNRHPELLFPQPWRETVTAAAEKHGLPPELLFSIMRQESSFNPRARSPADAFGLMQLLPEVALASAAKAEVPYARAEDLYTPDVNIPIGAYHLRQLWDRFSGRFILAVASYNASEASIRTWMKVRFQGDPISFIEDIPYEETRGYIRLVMRNLIFYRLLNEPGGEIAFPEWVLNLAADGKDAKDGKAQ
jgi:soluble lytic murein transglycosylase